MQRIINNLRRQPEAVRRHILHAFTIIAGAMLFFIWIYSLGTNFSNSDTQAKLGNDLKPLSTLKASIISGYDSMGAQDLNTEMNNF